MTALATLLSCADRKRLLERLRELRPLDREMRGPWITGRPG